jgi:uncharacterized protein YcbX
MQARIASLYRHPVKGFTPERLARAELVAGQCFPCDRLYAVEDGPSGFDPAAPGPHLEDEVHGAGQDPRRRQGPHRL